jgi:hypothetical protein
MVKQRKKIVVGFVLFFLTLGAFGQQTEVQRKVLYETSTYKMYAVDCEVAVDSLSADDSVYLQSKPPLIRQAEHLIENGWLTITHNYPQEPLYDRNFDFQIGKSVTDKLGTRLYPKTSGEYYHLDNFVGIENFYYDFDKISVYGFFNDLFSVSIDEVCNSLNTAGVSVSRQGQKLMVIRKDNYLRKETEIDFEHLIFEVRVFEYSMLVSTNRTEYRKQNERIIPARHTHLYYDVLPSGISYQITQIEDYLSYQVFGENGDILVNYPTTTTVDISTDSTQTTTPTAWTIQVLPNPATDNISVVFPIEINANMEVKIADVMGVVYFHSWITVVGNSFSVAIQPFPTGMYSITCINADGTANTYFLKQ